MSDEFLRLHDFMAASRANGPGRRAVVWVQGCTLGCAGCFNPETHAVDGGTRVAVAALFRRIVAAGNAEGAVGTDSADLIKGVTVSGGEPLQQMGAVAALLGRVRRETALSVVLFTGYAWEEVGRMPAAAALLKCVDVLVAGRYDATQRLDESRDLRSSANQTVHLLTGRYTPADLAAVPPAEAVVAPDGSVVLSGLGGVRWE